METPNDVSVETVEQPHSRPLSRLPKLPVWMLALAIGTAIVVVLGAAVDIGTASPQLCMSCHEMELRAHSWDESAHRVVACVKCHQEPTAWYEVPTRLGDRFALLSRDIKAHYSGDFEDVSIDMASPGASPIPDSVCLQCHDPNRKATSGYRILIDHVEHAKRNGECVSCHVRTAHPEETRGGPLTLMGQCYTCHGTAEQPEASAECGTCHPAGYELFPTSHTAASWARDHGVTSEADKRLCLMCHTETYCNDCHGMPMPHPARWDEGEAGHAPLATSDPVSCQRCHDGGPELCTMCHHSSYEPVKGTWVEQHNVEVRDEGTAYCFRCHGPTYCSYCHTRLVERSGPNG